MKWALGQCVETFLVGMSQKSHCLLKNVLGMNISAYNDISIVFKSAGFCASAAWIWVISNQQFGSLMMWCPSETLNGAVSKLGAYVYRPFHSYWDLIRISFCSHRNSTTIIYTIFCTNHDSYVVIFADICGVLTARTIITIKRDSIKFEVRV